MILTIDHPLAKKVVVLLNDKPLKCWMSANDEEGWVEIPDISSMAPLIQEPTKLEEGELTAWEEVPVKRIYGKITFFRLESK